MFRNIFNTLEQLWALNSYVFHTIFKSQGLCIVYNWIKKKYNFFFYCQCDILQDDIDHIVTGHSIALISFVNTKMD